ncbi:MAG TPA: hypothetical protein VK539_11220 [Myxococcaceae bacterium]|nr:hypothetical protein [Myxococcaceae bacterium]
MQPNAVPTAVSVVEALNPNQVLAFLAVLAVFVLLHMVWKAWGVLLLKGESAPPKRSPPRKRRKRRKAQVQAQAKEQPPEPRQ